MAVKQKTTGGISPEIAFLGLDLMQDQSHLEVASALWSRIARAVAGEHDARFLQITPSLYFDPDEGRITTRKRVGYLFLGKFTVQRAFEGGPMMNATSSPSA